MVAPPRGDPFVSTASCISPGLAYDIYGFENATSPWFFPSLHSLFYSRFLLLPSIIPRPAYPPLSYPAFSWDLPMVFTASRMTSPLGLSSSSFLFLFFLVLTYTSTVSRLFHYPFPSDPSIFPRIWNQRSGFKFVSLNRRRRFLPTSFPLFHGVSTLPRCELEGPYLKKL